MNTQRQVLVVDDQEINRKILIKILESDYDVITAENGEEALSILHSVGEGISAILLDIMMPILDGYGVLEVLAKDAFLSRIPVLVTSQKDGEDSELKALNFGASDFVSKPYNADILKKRLNNLIVMHEATTTVNILKRDVLTGLYSKEAFMHMVDLRLKREMNKKYDIVALDIVNFKLVNDTYGVEEGNKLLGYLADKLEIITKKKHNLCARVYADQFLLFMERTESYLECMVDDIESSMIAYPVDMKLHVKFGIYNVDDINVNVNAMCDRAVMAVKSIKSDFNKQYAYYDDSFREKMLVEQEITNDIDLALKDNQFKVYLQPKYNILEGKLAGAEALVRWIHPEKGFMNPGQFISILEKNGFITDLDIYVWNKTCEYIARWIKTGKKYVPVSVNVSRKDVYKQNLPEILMDIVTAHGLLPKHLHLEITESAYTENQEQLLSVVEKLKEQGFIIEMDDFGSGYSSLNMLSEFPIDILKLDMKFIQNSGSNIKNRSIMSSVIDLAKKIDLSVVAEGVEEQSQVTMLKGMGCDMVQGYYFAKPLTEEEFRNRLMSEPVII
ncbi:MAG: EAL domain-containing protein [Clostridiales bacterium]|nr:EAL domain-containing protein [Clostridiales bacterium]